MQHAEAMSLQQKRDFYRDGYVVLKNVVPQAMVEAAHVRIESRKEGENLAKAREMTDLVNGTATVYLASDTLSIVAEWLRRAGVSDGHLFRSVTKGGKVGTRLPPSQIPRIFKAMARAAGLDDEVVAALSGHSARVGATQDMIAAGVELPAILHAGRWKTATMVTRYGERLLAHRSGAAQLAKRQGRE